MVTIDEDRQKPSKCKNCSMMQTGILEGYCCYACSKNKGHGHGSACLRIDCNDNDWKN